LATWGALIVLTVVTVGASYIDLGGSWNLVLALVVATLKAAVVALIFMHLFFDDKFHAVIFGSSLLFLGIFIGFTMMDTETRGRAEAADGEHPADISQPFKGGTREAAMLRALHAPKVSPASATPSHPH
jgi:cytochrome c oxidase subunit 4